MENQEWYAEKLKEFDNQLSNPDLLEEQKRLIKSAKEDFIRNMPSQLKDTDNFKEKVIGKRPQDDNS